jgi:hypothetical protein
MLNILYDLWLESPSILAPGFIAAQIVGCLGSYLCLVTVRSKTLNAFSLSFAVALSCFGCLIIFAIIGLLAVSIGTFGMVRSWASFADAYAWGVFSLPFLAFIVSLIGFALTNRPSARFATSARCKNDTPLPFDSGLSG